MTLRRTARLPLVAGVLLVALLGATRSAAADVEKDHAAKMARGLDLFKKQVRPIFAEKCLKCHGGKATEASFDLSDRDRLLKGGESGPAVLPGKGKDSLLYKLTAHQKEPFMPHQAKKLPDDLIAHVAEWIDCGAPYDEALVARAPKE